MVNYCSNHLDTAERYNASLQGGPALNFCRIPLALARATLDTIAAGREKLTRTEVESLVAGCLAQQT